MKPDSLWLLMGFLVLREGAQAMDSAGQEERKGKVGFCPPSPSGLYQPPCKVTCEGDTECPGEAKCCEYACNYLCLPPRKEKAGHCPPPLMKKLHRPPLCDLKCSRDSECQGPEKCCETICGLTCQPPLEDKPGKCPRKQRASDLPGGPLYDTCRQDQECQGQKKCCFTGTCMNCIDVQ